MYILLNNNNAGIFYYMCDECNSWHLLYINLNTDTYEWKLCKKPQKYKINKMYRNKVPNEIVTILGNYKICGYIIDNFKIIGKYMDIVPLINEDYMNTFLEIFLPDVIDNIHNPKEIIEEEIDNDEIIEEEIDNDEIIEENEFYDDEPLEFDDEFDKLMEKINH